MSECMEPWNEVPELKDNLTYSSTISNQIWDLDNSGDVTLKVVGS